MARLLVEIDEALKRELKVRLIREGVTLKTWLTRAASAYVGDHPAPIAAPRVPPKGLHPQASPGVSSPPAPAQAPRREPDLAPRPRPTMPEDDYLD